MDWVLDDEAFEQATPAADRELVPEGEHEFKIERASEDAKHLGLAMSHADKRYKWVWPNLPKGTDLGTRLGSELRRALGMTREEWHRHAIDDMVGRRVVAEVYHRVVDSGRTFVNVRKFHPAKDPAPAVERAVAEPSSRTPVKPPARLANVPEDDIPF